MTLRLVCTQYNANALYILDPDTPSLDAFDPQLSAPLTNMGSRALWADEDGHLICTPRKASDNLRHAFHLEAMQWVDKGVVPAGADLISLSGPNYQNVWGVNGDSYDVLFWDGSSWVIDRANLTGSRLDQISCCDDGDDEVWAVSNNLYQRVSGARGSGVWTDRTSQMRSETGFSWQTICGVYMASATQVFVLLRGGNDEYRIAMWNGSGFVVAGGLYMYHGIGDCCEGSFQGSSASSMAWIVGDPSWGHFHIWTFNGSTVARLTPEPNLNSGSMIALGPAGAYAVGGKQSPNRIEVWDFSSTPALLTSVNVTTSDYFTGAAFWEDSHCPYLDNQIPAPDSENNAADAPVTFDLLDAAGDVLEEATEIYIDDTLAWTRARPVAGFDVAKSDDSFSVTPAEPFEPGAHTVRVLAIDEASCPMDESYSFSTRQLFIEPEAAQEERDEENRWGIDLKLDTSHDVVVENYDLVLVAGLEEVAQHVLVGLRLFRGEWFLAEEAGIPYWQHILTDAPNTKVVEGLFRQDILGDADIEAITEFEMDHDGATRKLDVDFKAVSKIGIIDVDAVFP